MYASVNEINRQTAEVFLQCLGDASTKEFAPSLPGPGGTQARAAADCRQGSAKHFADLRDTLENWYRAIPQRGVEVLAAFPRPPKNGRLTEGASQAT